MSEELKQESQVEIKTEEPKVEETQTQESQLSKSEQDATALGWMPKEQWVEEGHDADDWKPAKVFLEHGQMIGKIRQQSKELADARQAIQFINQKNQQVFEKGYQH